MQDGTIRVVDYKTGSHQPRPLPSVESIFDPVQLKNHSDYYLQTFVYADIVSRQYDKVSPALLFIQHAAARDYDPTLRFGQEPIRDISEHTAVFNAMLEQKVAEIFSPAIPFVPTADLDICRTCPYKLLCRK